MTSYANTNEESREGVADDVAEYFLGLLNNQDGEAGENPEKQDKNQDPEKQERANVLERLRASDDVPVFYIPDAVKPLLPEAE